jgi:hypothetical protein
MELPFGSISANKLEMQFSTADYSVANVFRAVREHLDMLNEMGVIFLGLTTDVSAGSRQVFQPVPIKAVFYSPTADNAIEILERTYQIVWKGLVNTFPDEAEWAESKAAYAEFIASQADLLRARAEVQSMQE